jgi:hypothetical protein
MKSRRDQMACSFWVAGSPHAAGGTAGAARMKLNKGGKDRVHGLMAPHGGPEPEGDIGCGPAVSGG